jgi:hypothetical protein
MEDVRIAALVGETRALLERMRRLLADNREARDRLQRARARPVTAK